MYTPSLRANDIADWIETCALATNGALGLSRLIELGERVGYANEDLALGKQTMSRRSEVLGSSYPFAVGEGVGARPEAPFSVWTALLLMRQKSPVRGREVAHEAKLFERLTSVALQNLYGSETLSVNFGWPSDAGRPQSFPDAIRWLAAKMGVEIGLGFRPPSRKDGGVDIVVWRPFSDGRSGFPVALIQCTLEKDYLRKFRDIELKVWAGWLQLDSDPVVALAVPEVVASGEQWNDVARRGIMLDRLRLTGLIAAVAMEASIQKDMHVWLTTKLAELQKFETGE